MSSNSSKNLDMHRIKSAAMDSEKIVEAEIGSVYEVSFVEQDVENDENQDHIQIMEKIVSQTAEAVKKQEALVKGKAVESERHQLDAISDNDFREVLEQEKLEEDVFLVESSMSIGNSYWCRSRPTT
ncbi:hypothetical protein F2Q69_00046395 [Brassica cretica]|uniref:Uncharacterized protein n=1 Tax=Brassica cretica TaxID=69181 RepID=A0A8S9Q812_BRACR|nr:hypothetical protein F2Q69_00046395 [Brassica cretica]